MIRFFDKADFNFLTAQKRAAIVALAFMLPGLLLLAVRGFNLSIEFTGGTLTEIRASSTDVTTAALRAALGGAGLTGLEIVTFGAETEFLIRARLSEDADQSEDVSQQTATVVEETLTNTFGEGTIEVVRTEAIGPKVGGELRQKAILAILMGFGAIFVYLSMRMEWRFAIAAVAATIHDIFSSLAFVSYLNIEVTLAVATALLFIVGYSVNDTIVTFDRVRENLRKYRRTDLRAIVNRSINETLPRTVLTSGTTLAATMAWVLLGGEVLQGFAMVMTFGILTGTFSSIFIASPILLAVERKWPGESVRGTRAMAGPGSATIVKPEDTQAQTVAG